MNELVFYKSEWKSMTVRISTEAKDRRDRLSAEKKCLGCEKDVSAAQTRCGLCGTCYQAVIRAEKGGKVTRQELIKRGRMMPPAKGGRPPSSKFSQELSEM